MIQFMKQIGIFVLLGKTLLHFCPSEKYEKYLKLIFGFMVVMQFVSPVLSLGSGSTMEEYEKNKVDFEVRLEESLQEVEDKWFLYKEEIEAQVEKDRAEAEKMVQEEWNKKEAEKEQESESNPSDTEVEDVEIEVIVYE